MLTGCSPGANVSAYDAARERLARWDGGLSEVLDSAHHIGKTIRLGLNPGKMTADNP